MQECTFLDRQVLLWLISGRCRSWIAGRLSVPESAVERHIARVLSETTRSAIGWRAANQVASQRPESMHALRALWESHRGQALLPAYESFTFLELQPWASDLAIMEPTPDGGDMFVRLAGRHILSVHQREVGGHWLGEMVPAANRDEVLRPPRRAFQERAPQYERRVLHDGPEVFTLHRHLLPCARDGWTPDIILAQIIYEMQDARRQLRHTTLFEAVGA